MAFRINNVRLSFPNIWKPVEFKPGDGRPRFDATFLVEPGSENDKKIRAAIEAAGKEVFADKWDKIKKGFEGNSNKYCYPDGDTKEYDGYEGMMYLSCHSKTKPAIYDRSPKKPDGTANLLTEEDGRPYSGCYVNATVEIYVQKGENPGVRGSFTGIQFARDGEAFSSGRPAVADDFEDLGGDTPDDSDLV